MKKLIAVILAACLLLSLGIAAGEEEKQPLQDNLVTTKQSVTIGGKTLEFNATAGTIALETDMGQFEIFFTAYTLDGVEDPSKRPVTFAFNGGPGSASLWLQLGLLGPTRMALSAEGKVEQVPTALQNNEYSILDMTDLVFIDPVGTGYSGVLPGTEANAFYTYAGDIASVGDFIRLYTTRYERWASPKYVAGESYGTTRAVGLCDYLLSQHHMNLNGLLLISSINDFSSIEAAPGNDLPYINYLPSFAASAWYHHRLDEKYQSMELTDLLEEVRSFASGEYQSALYKGTRMTDAELDAVAASLSSYIGLSKEKILDNNLRITLNDFCSGLLRDQQLMIGRIDSRYTGPVTTGSLEDGESDPSSTGISEAFAGAYNDYVTRVLKFKTDKPYTVLSLDVNQRWDFGYSNSVLMQQEVIRDCMSKNELLKVWVVCGYYDLATPFYAAEWVYSHLFLNEELKPNLQFTYYPAGHMFYLHEPSLQQFRKNAEEWYGYTE